MREYVEHLTREEFPLVYRFMRISGRIPGMRRYARELSLLWDAYIGTSIDPVTELVQRRLFMRELTKTVMRCLPGLETEGLPPQRPSDLEVLVGDLAFLNYFNSVSYAWGDEVLHRVARIVREEFEGDVVCRYGGDEIAIWSLRRLSDVIESRDVAQAAIAGEPNHGLDIEYASLSDVYAFTQIFPLPEERRVKHVVQVLVDIAACRAQIAKYYARIEFLIKLWIGGEGGYQEFITYARKGAGNITDEHVSDFAMRWQSGENISEACLGYALTAKGASMQGDPREEAIFEIAASIFTVKVEF
jgi:diguanylate cyclase (GGDEF)-like protein